MRKQHKHEKFIPGKDSGTDLGNPKADIVGEEIDSRGVYSDDLINTAIRAGDSQRRSERRRRVEVESGPSIPRKVAVRLGTVATVVALGAGIGKVAPDEQPPVTKQDMIEMDSKQHLDRIAEESGELPETNK